ncbi:MAG: dihydroorotate dehydrogenase, partial [Muribaculaceae bacterium]|nr:dihydroorotate dehydrogenase [Muribaculaceae bacterium]
ALEFIMAGASAVQIGTANFIDPSVTVKVIDGLEDYCRRHGVDRLMDLRGII